MRLHGKNMLRNLFIIALSFFAFEASSQNVIGLVAEHFKHREGKGWEYYYCYDTNTPAFQYITRNNRFGFPVPVWEKLRFAINRENVPRIDSLMVTLGKNLPSESVKDNISSCVHVRRKRLISKEKAQNIFSEKRDLDNTYYLRWYQFGKKKRKRDLRNIFIYYFSKPIQIDDCIMVEVVRKRNPSAWDLYFCYYLLKTNELIVDFVDQD